MSCSPEAIYCSLDWLPKYLMILAVYTTGLLLIVGSLYRGYKWHIDPNRHFAKFLKETSRLTSDSKANLLLAAASATTIIQSVNAPVAPLQGVSGTPWLSDRQLLARMVERFAILDQLIQESINGNITSLIISGPAGLGKSFPVEKALSESDTPYRISKGYAKATGLFKLLYEHRHPGSILVIDDMDSVFGDEIALNMLKAALDTTEVRNVSYLSERSMKDDQTDEKLPKTFQMEGSVIFITNYDFDAMIAKGHKLAPHLEALVSRSHYVSLDMTTNRHYLLRIRQVAETGLFARKEMTPQQVDDVMDFIVENSDRLRELSLRVALKIADIRKTNASNWRKVAEFTTCRNV